MKKNPILYRFLTLIAFTTACNTSSFGGKASSSKQATPSSGSTAANSASNGGIDVDYDTFLVQGFEKQLAISTENFVAMAQAIATNDPIDILGYSFSGISDKLLAHEDQLSQLAVKYANLGEFLKTVNIYSENDIDPAMVETGLSSLAKAMTTDTQPSPAISAQPSEVDISSVLGANLNNSTQTDRFLMGVAGLALMNGNGTSLKLAEDSQSAMSATIQANADKGWANPQEGFGECRQIGWDVGPGGAMSCYDAVDPTMPCPCPFDDDDF